MSTAEQDRHLLHGKLEDLIGRTEAATLMSYLPPVGWADVATKHDLVALERRFDGLEVRMDRFDQRMDRFERRMERDLAGVRSEIAVQGRMFMLTTAGSILTTAALAFAAARLG